MPFSRCSPICGGLVIVWLVDSYLRCKSFVFSYPSATASPRGDGCSQVLQSALWLSRLHGSNVKCDKQRVSRGHSSLDRLGGLATPPLNLLVTLLLCFAQDLRFDVSLKEGVHTASQIRVRLARGRLCNGSRVWSIHPSCQSSLGESLLIENRNTPPP